MYYRATEAEEGCQEVSDPWAKKVLKEWARNARLDAKIESEEWERMVKAVRLMRGKKV